MALMRAKKIHVLGVDLTLAMDARRAESLARSPLWQRVGKPSLQLLRRAARARRGGTNAVTNSYTGARGVDAVTLSLTPQAPRVRMAGDEAQASALRERVKRIAWYHTIDLPHGVTVQGVVDYRGQGDWHGLPPNLAGKRCLDVGTFDGFWAFEMENRGAAEVVGLDIESLADMDFPRRKRAALVEEAMQLRGTMDVGQGFNLAREILGSNVQRSLCNVYDLAPEKVGGLFDVVFISDVLVHLRDPQTAIENIFSVMNPGGVFLLTTAFDPSLDAFDAPLSEYHGTDYSWVWWSHSSKSLRRMLEVAGFNPIEELNRIRAANPLGEFHKIVLRGGVTG